MKFRYQILLKLNTEFSFIIHLTCLLICFYKFINEIFFFVQLFLISTIFNFLKTIRLYYNFAQLFSLIILITFCNYLIIIITVYWIIVITFDISDHLLIIVRDTVLQKQFDFLQASSESRMRRGAYICSSLFPNSNLRLFNRKNLQLSKAKIIIQK